MSDHSGLRNMYVIACCATTVGSVLLAFGLACNSNAFWLFLLPGVAGVSVAGATNRTFLNRGAHTRPRLALGLGLVFCARAVLDKRRDYGLSVRRLAL